MDACSLFIFTENSLFICLFHYKFVLSSAILLFRT
nr:MAG TPA: hypothetical protein [Caudoviricetes sp.]DAO71836.1 MAG TPA: hypothetical protein [Caudoviricetes sp.]